MTLIKKIMIGIISLCLVGSLLVGCGKDSSKDTENTTENSDSSDSFSETTSESADFTIDTAIKSDVTGEYTIDVTTLKDNETVPIIEDVKKLNLNLEDYIKLNSDTVAWLKIPGTLVNYPVLQSDDNSYYLNRNSNKEISRAGSLFADYRNVITGSKKSDNVIIYGHNMANGSYFGTLNNYKSLSFYKQNSTLYYNTTEKKSTYVIIACFYANTIADQDNGTVFKYHLKRDFASRSDFNSWKDNVSKRSEYTTWIDYNENDSYLTLSTCASIYENARWVVIAREIREGETIDSNKIAENPDTYYPAKWYGMNG